MDHPCNMPFMMIVFIAIVLLCSQIAFAHECRFHLDEVKAIRNAGKICGSLSFLPPTNEHGNVGYFDIRFQTVAINMTYSILRSYGNEEKATTLSNTQCLQEPRVFHWNRNRNQSRMKLFLCGPLEDTLYDNDTVIVKEVTDTLFGDSPWTSVNCTVQHMNELTIEKRNVSHPNACAETNVFCSCLTSCQSFHEGQGAIYSCRFPMSYPEIIPSGSIAITSPSGSASFVDEWNAICIDLRFDLSSDVEYVTLRRPPSYDKPMLMIAPSTDHDISLDTLVFSDAVGDTCTNMWDTRIKHNDVVHLCSRVDRLYSYMLSRLALFAPKRSVVEYDIIMLGGGYQKGVLLLKDVISSFPINKWGQPTRDVCDTDGAQSVCSNKCISSCTALLQGHGPIWCFNKYRNRDEVESAVSKLLMLQAH